MVRSFQAATNYVIKYNFLYWVSMNFGELLNSLFFAASYVLQFVYLDSEDSWFFLFYIS